MRVVGLWRFPVKSMQGQSLERADIDELGIVGDRQWALVDTETGLALTARREPQLLLASARWRDGAVEIELPDGSIAEDDDSLSQWIGRPVVLRHAGPKVHGTYEIATDSEDEAGSRWVQWDGPEGTFHDSTSTRVSIMSTASMRQWALRRFRTNVVVEADVDSDGDGDGEEDGLVGHHVTIGTVSLDVVKQIDRCVMTTRPQPGGIERDLDVLRTINAERGSLLGVSAMVTRAGTVTIGDELRVDG
ncbi:MAG: MOSC domain-containing protein [Ilumatobacteraceae bacterium]